MLVVVISLTCNNGNHIARLLPDEERFPERLTDCSRSDYEEMAALCFKARSAVPKSHVISTLSKKELKIGLWHFS